MWEDVRESATDITSNELNGLPYKSLEHIHVFVLANILRRPIIIISDTVVHYPSGSVHESVNNLDGIYLPLLWKSSDCVRYPVVLGFANSHFAPLLGMDVRLDEAKKDLRDLVPLVKANFQQRFVHFLSDSEEKQTQNLLNEYLHLTELEPTGSLAMPILCAKLRYQPLEDELNLFVDHYEELTKSFRKGHTEMLHTSCSASKIDSFNLNLNLNETPKASANSKKKVAAAKETPVRRVDMKTPVRRDQRQKSPSKRPAQLDISKANANVIHSKESKTDTVMDVSEARQGDETTTPVCEKCKRLPRRNSSFCLHHYATSPLREDPPRCKNSECSAAGSPRNDDYCRRCVLYSGVSESDMDILRRLPKSKNVGRNDARRLSKCREPSCYATSTASTLGYCPPHFLERYKSGQQAIPSEQDVANYLDASSRRSKQKQEASPEELEMEEGDPYVQHKYLCATPGCAGVRCRDSELCLACDRTKILHRRQPEPFVIPHYHVANSDDELMETNDDERRSLSSSRSDSDVIESREPSRSGSPVCCVGPGCMNRGLDTYNGLCQECYATLLESRIKKTPQPKPTHHTSKRSAVVTNIKLRKFNRCCILIDVMHGCKCARTMLRLT